MRLRQSVHLVVLGALSSLSIVLLVTWVGEPVAEAFRGLVYRVTPVRAVGLLAVVMVLTVVGSWIASTRAGSRLKNQLIPADRAWGDSTAARSYVAASCLGAIVGAAAGLHIVLSNSFAAPHIFSDELIYSSLGKDVATGSVRGVASSGYGLGYPLFIAPAYVLAGDGARAFEAIQSANSTVMAAAAVPLYFIARRVLGVAWSLGAASLFVASPWMGYSALVMTEALFTFVFLLFCLSLVRALERPTPTRQLVCVGLLAALCSVRIQGIVLGPAIVAAVAIAAPPGERAAFVRRFAPTWVVLTVVAVVGLLVAGGDITALLGAYGVLVQDTSVVNTPIWAAKNVAAIELGMGILVLALLPRALGSFLGRAASQEERALGAVTLSCFIALLVSVAVLSASPYGLDRVHERNLFYVVPLIVTCVLGWAGKRASGGYVGAALGGIVVLFPLALARSDFDETGKFDAPSLDRWHGVAMWVADPRIPFVGAAAVAFVVALSRRPSRLSVAVVTVIAFATVTPSTFYEAPISRSDARKLAWVDRTVPSGTQALLLWPSAESPSCGTGRGLDQLALWTEFFNVSVGTVGQMRSGGSASRSGVAKIDIGSGGRLLRGGAGLLDEYVIADSRVVIRGAPIAVSPPAPGGAIMSPTLTLWRTRLPVRLDTGANAGSCAVVSAPST